MITKELLRAGDSRDTYSCPTDKRNVRCLKISANSVQDWRTADLLQMGGLERVNDSVERASPTTLHCIFRVSAYYHRFMRHQLFYALRSRCPALLPAKKTSIFLAVPKRILTTKYSTSIRLAHKRKVSCTDIWVPNLPLTQKLWQSPKDNLSTPCGNAQHMCGTSRPGVGLSQLGAVPGSPTQSSPHVLWRFNAILVANCATLCYVNSFLRN